MKYKRKKHVFLPYYKIQRHHARGALSDCKRAPFASLYATFCNAKGGLFEKYNIHKYIYCMQEYFLEKYNM